MGRLVEGRGARTTRARGLAAERRPLLVCAGGPEDRGPLPHRNRPGHQTERQALAAAVRKFDSERLGREGIGERIRASATQQTDGWCSPFGWTTRFSTLGKDGRPTSGARATWAPPQLRPRPAPRHGRPFAADAPSVFVVGHPSAGGVCLAGRACRTPSSRTTCARATGARPTPRDALPPQTRPSPLPVRHPVLVAAAYRPYSFRKGGGPHGFAQGAAASFNRGM